MFYLPVAPDIDDPEGDVVPGYDQKPVTDKSVLVDNTNQKMGENGPPKKKPKITDVNINGEVYNQNSVLAGSVTLQGY